MEKVGFGLGCVKTEKLKRRLGRSSPISAIGRRKCSISLCPAAALEKFVLAIVLLYAFLHGQGHEATSAAASGNVRFLSCRRDRR
jgi:hypothetical protein